MADAGVLDEVEAGLHNMFGVRAARASTSFVGVEPVAVLRFELEARRCYVTLGMSRHPMTSAAALELDDAGPRAELFVESRDDAGDLWRRLAVLAAAPVVEGVVYADGASVDLSTPLLAGSRCTGGIVITSSLPIIQTSGGPVALLQLVPATAEELAWARVRGADALRARWREQGSDLLDLRRPAATLS